MSSLSCVRTALFLSLWLAASATAAWAQQALAIQDVHVLSPDARQFLAGHTVVVRGDRIAAVGPSEDIVVPRRASVIEGRGRFLIPGLTDLHVHIRRSKADTEKLYGLFLEYGVTTVLNLDGGASVLADRAAVAAAERLGPTIFTSGAIVRGPGDMTRARGEEIAREQIEAGYDLIKVYNGLSAEGYRGIVEVARGADVKVIGHAVRAVGLSGALESEQHLAHMEEVVYGFFTWSGRELAGDLPDDPAARLDLLLDEGEIAALARQVASAGIFVIPNLTAYHHIALQLDDLTAMLARPDVVRMPSSMTRSWEKDRNGYFQRSNPERFREVLEQTFPFLQKLTLAFEQAGVPLLAGTDVGIPVILAGSSLHDELQELVDAGLAPAQALAAATVHAAAFLRRADAGRVAPGAVADLVLLREDPLAAIENTRKIDEVLVRGQLVER